MLWLLISIVGLVVSRGMMDSMVDWSMMNNSMVDRGMMNNRGMDSMMNNWSMDSMVYYRGMDSMMSSWSMSNYRSTCKSSKRNCWASRGQRYNSSQHKTLEKKFLIKGP